MPGAVLKLLGQRVPYGPTGSREQRGGRELATNQPEHVQKCAPLCEGIAGRLDL